MVVKRIPNAAGFVENVLASLLLRF